MSREERFRHLFELHFHRVLGYAMRRTRRRADAEDVVAEVFTIAWRRLDEVPEGSIARAWLYGTARRVLSNQRRGAERRARLAERLHAEPTWPGEEAAAENEVVAAAFAALGEADREILALAYWEGLSPAEIAVVLGISGGGARVRLHRARRRLSNELATAGGSGRAPQVMSAVEVEEA